jgi:hypothetical protein
MDDLPETKIGKFHRHTSGKLSYEIFNLDAQYYREVSDLIKNEFGLMKWGIAVVGLDVMFATYRKWNKKVGIEWDNWVGFTVIAQNKSAEPLVVKIANYLEHSEIVERMTRRSSTRRIVGE